MASRRKSDTRPLFWIRAGQSAGHKGFFSFVRTHAPVRSARGYLTQPGAVVQCPAMCGASPRLLPLDYTQVYT
jgi:hypothetical protein